MANAQNTPQDLLDQILSTGREMITEGKDMTGDLSVKGKALAKKGEDYLVDKLDLEDTEEGRKDLRKNVKVGAAAGALALILSNRSSRKLAALGGLGALGVIAYKGYKRDGKMPNLKDEVIGMIKGKKAKVRSETLLIAMVAAAKADGVITDKEEAVLESHDKASFEVLRAAMDHDPDPKAIAALADSNQAAHEIYAVSSRVADGINPKERDYLDELAMALKLDPDVAAKIETDVRTG